jgi:hypothetical protein
MKFCEGCDSCLDSGAYAWIDGLPYCRDCYCQIRPAVSEMCYVNLPVAGKRKKRAKAAVMSCAC